MESTEQAHALSTEVDALKQQLREAKENAKRAQEMSVLQSATSSELAALQTKAKADARSHEETAALYQASMEELAALKRAMAGLQEQLQDNAAEANVSARFLGENMKNLEEMTALRSSTAEELRLAKEQLKALAAKDNEIERLQSAISNLEKQLAAAQKAKGEGLSSSSVTRQSTSSSPSGTTTTTTTRSSTSSSFSATPTVNLSSKGGKSPPSDKNSLGPMPLSPRSEKKARGDANEDELFKRAQRLSESSAAKTPDPVNNSKGQSRSTGKGRPNDAALEVRMSRTMDLDAGKLDAGKQKPRGKGPLSPIDGPPKKDKKGKSAADMEALERRFGM